MKQRIVQISALLILHLSWGPQAKWFCNPVLSCHSCPLYFFACPIGVLVHFSGYHIFPFLVLGTLLLIGVLVGRLFCGWICPFGLFQDILYKVPGRKINLPKWSESIKYLVLIFMVILIPFFLGELTMFSFCRICPAATLEVSTPYMIKSGIGDISLYRIIRYGFLFGIIGLSIVATRGFCRVFCPIGAIMAGANYFSFWRVNMKKGSCTSCGLCDKVCPTQVEPSKRAIKNIPVNRTADCVVCHRCTSACPQRSKKKGPKPDEI